MSFDTANVFVVLKWPAEPGRPRYSFATITHANEIQASVERVETCSSLERAASLAARLNTEDRSAA